MTVVGTVAIPSPGDMGSGVGRELIARGFRVLTCLAGRSERSRALAEGAGLELADSLDALVASADVVLSILPPAVAEGFAAEAAAALRRTGARPAFADCNAISPATARRVAARITGAGPGTGSGLGAKGGSGAGTGAVFIDAGIIGAAPGKSGLPTRFYCSGPDTSALEALDGPNLRVRRLGDEVGQASAMKMVYAAVTKGTFTLHAAALLAARVHGLSGPFHAELAESLPAELAAMRRMTPRLPLDAARWVGEMHEIAETLAAAGLPADFHQGAARVFELLARTPIAAETRETVDPSRTLDDALDVYAETLASIRDAGGGRNGG